MEWIERLNSAISYIEEHLTDEIDYDQIAKIACCSTFQFQRMFSYIADVTLSEYIRRRRMTRAVFDLQNSDEKIIDIALKYGYDSPTAFNRAFQSIHGIAPKKTKEEGMKLKAFSPISFKITIKGESEMNYRIEKKEAIRIVGVKEHYECGLDESLVKVPMFWNKVHKEGLIPKLCSMINKEPEGIMGVCSSASIENFDYYIAVASDKVVSENMEEFIIPESNWAVFECIGAMPNAIQNLQKRIVTEWLPNSGYEYADAPDIELYFDGDQSADDYRSEVWLPIRKKQV